VIQLDEPWLQARAEEARRLALPAIDRAFEGIPGPDGTAPLLRLCLCRSRQTQPQRVPARAHGFEGRVDLDRSRRAQSRSRHPRRPRRQDRDLWRHQYGRPRAGDAANRRRSHPRRIGALAAGAADPGSRLRHEIHPARSRLCQAQSIGRGCRDRPSRAYRELVSKPGFTSRGQDKQLLTHLDNAVSCHDKRLYRGQQWRQPACRAAREQLPIRSQMMVGPCDSRRCRAAKSSSFVRTAIPSRTAYSQICASSASRNPTSTT
jgi:hypothetical protein